MPHRAYRRAKLELIIVLFLALVTTLAFWWTDWDVRLANWFYVPAQAKHVWRYQDWKLLKYLYDYAFPVVVIAGLTAFSIYILSHFHHYTLRFRRKALYILLVILLGPGLLINLIVKDHWGRPRPHHVQAFGGEYAYVPPLKIGHTPDKSFVCGHCSVGYVFFVLYFLSQNHKILYLLLTLSLAGLLGFTRMSAGAHFLSDVLWSGYLMFLLAYALYYGWFIKIKR